MSSPPNGHARTLLQTEFLPPFSHPATAAWLVATTFVTILFFNLFPGIDRAVSGWFFVAEACTEEGAEGICGSFPAAAHPLLNAVRDFFHVLPVAVAIGLLVIALFVSYRTRNANPASEWLRFAEGAYVAVTSLVLCSGVLVNMLLKEYSGRPRPVHTDLFGGKSPFVPVGEGADYCVSNCSFVSGESSTAFWLVCLVPLAPKRWRPALWVLTIAIALWTAGLRVAFGGHYLSDVIIAGLLTLATFSGLATLAAMLRARRPQSVTSTLH